MRIGMSVILTANRINSSTLAIFGTISFVGCKIKMSSSNQIVSAIFSSQTEKIPNSGVA